MPWADDVPVIMQTWSLRRVVGSFGAKWGIGKRAAEGLEGLGSDFEGICLAVWSNGGAMVGTVSEAIEREREGASMDGCGSVGRPWRRTCGEATAEVNLRKE